MAQNKFRKTFFGYAALPIWLALATYGLTELFSRYPGLTETVYSQTIYPGLAFLLSFLSKWVSFSLDDAFYGLLFVSFIVILLLTIFKKIRIGRFFLILVQTFSLTYTLFYCFWGFNYYRTGINNRLQITKSKPDSLQFVRVFEHLIDQTNESYCTFEKMKHHSIDSLVEISYKKNASFLKIHYPQGTRRTKPITLSNFFAKASIAGYYG